MTADVHLPGAGPHGRRAQVIAACICGFLAACDEGSHAIASDSAPDRYLAAAPDPEFAWAIEAGAWRATNEQALSITGNLTVGPPDFPTQEASLAFANGVTLYVKPAPLPHSEQAIRARLTQARRLLDAPGSVFPMHFVVVRERVATSAPYAGLCGGLRARTLAVAEFANEQGERTLRIASFSGPPPMHDKTSTAAIDMPPCFTFEFDRSFP